MRTPSLHSVSKEDHAGCPEPLSLEAAKQWLKVEHDLDDEIIKDLIRRVRVHIEDSLNISLVPKTVEAVFLNVFTQREIRLPFSPVANVFHVDKSCCQVPFQVYDCSEGEFNGYRFRSAPVYIRRDFFAARPAYGKLTLKYNTKASDDSRIPHVMKVGVAYLYENRDKATLPKDLVNDLRDLNWSLPF